MFTREKLERLDLDLALRSKKLSYPLERETYVYHALAGVTQTLYATNENVRAVKYGSGRTLAGLTCWLSIVNGVAFISNPSVDLRQYVGFKITLNDGSKNLVGWIKAPGEEETFAANAFLTPDFSEDANWVKQTNWSIAAGVATCVDAGTNRTIYQNVGTALALTYMSIDIVRGTSPLYFRAGNYQSAAVSQVGTYSKYITMPAGAALLGFISVAPSNIDIDNAVAKRAMTPDATGVTIVSARGGTTYNWASMETGFNPMAASFTATIRRE